GTRGTGGTGGNGGTGGTGGTGATGTGGNGSNSQTITTDANGNIVNPGGIENVAATSAVSAPGHDDGTPIFVVLVVLALLAVVFRPPASALARGRRRRARG